MINILYSHYQGINQYGRKKIEHDGGFFWFIALFLLIESKSVPEQKNQINPLLQRIYTSITSRQRARTDTKEDNASHNGTQLPVQNNRSASSFPD